VGTKENVARIQKELYEMKNHVVINLVVTARSMFEDRESDLLVEQAYNLMMNGPQNKKEGRPMTLEEFIQSCLNEQEEKKRDEDEQDED